jgi:hypothetical protein
MQDDSTILIFTGAEAEPPANGRRTRSGIEDFARRTADRAVEVSTNALKGSVLQAYRNCLDIIQTLPENSDGAVLETVTFSLAVNGEGQVGLLSTAAKVGTQVGLTFQVRIPPPDKRDAGQSA